MTTVCTALPGAAVVAPCAVPEGPAPARRACHFIHLRAGAQQGLPALRPADDVSKRSQLPFQLHCLSLPHPLLPSQR